MGSGQSVTLKATVLPANASNKKVTWKSNNTKLATVSSSGKVTTTGSANGTVKITATTADGKKTASCTITVKKPKVSYRTHVQTYGWQGYASDGAMSGTQGQSKRLEGINIKISNLPYSGGISYRTHIQTYGWESGWKSNGAMSGTTGQAKRLEAIQIKLTGEMVKHYDVYYRVHAQHFGWMGWAKNGASAGTAGYAYRLEGIQIVLVNKGGLKPSVNLGGNRQTTAAVFSNYNNLNSGLFNKIYGSYMVYRWSGYSRDSITIQKDGKFSGISQIGVTKQSISDYSGKFTDVKKIDNYTYSMRVSDYRLAHPAGTRGSYGSASVEYFDIGFKNKVFTVYLPGHKVETLPYWVKDGLKLKNSLQMPTILNKAVIYYGEGELAFV